MTQTTEKALSLSNLFFLLQANSWLNWSVTRVREKRGQVFEACPVLKVNLLTSQQLNIHTSNGTFQVPSTHIYQLSSWEIEIRGTIMVKQERKKIEGGGFREVPVIVSFMTLTNESMRQAVYQAECEEEQRRAKEEQRQKEETERLEQQARAFRKARFLDDLTTRFVGHTLTNIAIEDGNIALTFDDGNTLNVELVENDDSGDWCGECGSGDPRITVNGTALRNIEP